MVLRTQTTLSGRVNLLRLGETIAARRREIGMTQIELAQKTHRHQADISRLERGVNEPTLQTLANVAHALKLDTLSLIATAFD